MTTFTTDDRLHAEKDGSFTIDCRQKPLTDEQVWQVGRDMGYDFTNKNPNNVFLQFARAIEKAHGIR